MAQKSIQLNDFALGVCYYPEHWEESLWADDFRRMKEMNFSVIRIAEFAWSIFEPEEGVFQFDFFDRVLDLAQEYKLQVILCTPTATPPAWLTYKYPEVLNVSRDGVTYQHGQRRHYNYSSPIYRMLCARITTKMAEHYKNHPAVIGWQIDNELNCEINVFYADADHAAFRKWLQQKYSSLEKLNHAWGAVFWNQTYSNWEQIFLTRPTPSDSPNPHQALDEIRFISDNTISFAKLQADILREIAPSHWVTTNGVFGHLDNHRMTNELLDFISYDSYPTFSAYDVIQEENPLLDRKWSLNLSNVRSISPHFCVMEQQSGPGGWTNRIGLPSPRPGQMRLWTYQSIAHGADMLLYFRWRTATIGTEIYWHGINDYHNQPNRRVAEATQIGQELAKIGKEIVGTTFIAEVALVRDYDNEWDGELDNWHGPLEAQSQKAWFKALQHRHIPVNLLNMKPETQLDELLHYKLLVYPHPTILTEECAKLLEAYVEQGGMVIFGARTGYKNLHGHCNMRAFPGSAAELCGITVEDFTLIKGYYKAPPVRWMNGSGTALATADLFNDILRVESPTVEVIAEYAAEYYEGKPVLTKNTYGSGSAWYYGAAFNEHIAGEIIERMGLKSLVNDICEVPLHIETIVRQSKAGQMIFLLNYSSQPQQLHFKQEVIEMISGNKYKDNVEIEAYGVMIVTL
jgi:beta-galactosidase